MIRSARPWSVWQMADEGTENLFVPTPMHRALDRLTAAMVTLQRLQRQVAHEEALTSAEAGAALSEIADHMRELSTILTDIYRESPEQRLPSDSSLSE
jgi:hypothetical protein